MSKRNPGRIDPASMLEPAAPAEFAPGEVPAGFVPDPADAPAAPVSPVKRPGEWSGVLAPVIPAAPAAPVPGLFAALFGKMPAAPASIAGTMKAPADPAPAEPVKKLAGSRLVNATLGNSAGVAVIFPVRARVTYAERIPGTRFALTRMECSHEHKTIALAQSDIDALPGHERRCIECTRIKAQSRANSERRPCHVAGIALKCDPE